MTAHIPRREAMLNQLQIRLTLLIQLKSLTFLFLAEMTNKINYGVSVNTIVLQKGLVETEDICHAAFWLEKERKEKLLSLL